jgi:hypothetical protein
MFCVRAAGMCFRWSDISDRMTARNDSALIAKQMAYAVMSATPQRFSIASVPPARTGPIIRATLNWIEFNAIALVKSCLPTSDGISDWYAGPPNACAVPVKESSGCAALRRPLSTERREDSSGGELYPLRCHQRQPAVVAINDDPADEREQHDRDLRRNASGEGDADVVSGTSQFSAGSASGADARKRHHGPESRGDAGRRQCDALALEWRSFGASLGWRDGPEPANCPYRNRKSGIRLPHPLIVRSADRTRQQPREHRVRECQLAGSDKAQSWRRAMNGGVYHIASQLDHH